VKCQKQEKCPCLEEEETKENKDESNHNAVPAAGEAPVGESVTGENISGESPADEQPGDDDEEEFCIVHVDDLAEPTTEGPPVEP
jgi:hypothetical protein